MTSALKLDRTNLAQRHRGSGVDGGEQMLDLLGVATGLKSHSRPICSSASTSFSFSVIARASSPGATTSTAPSLFRPIPPWSFGLGLLTAPAFLWSPTPLRATVS